VLAGRADELHNGFVVDERPATPVLGDVAEEAMLDLVPLGRLFFLSSPLALAAVGVLSCRPHPDGRTVETVMPASPSPPSLPNELSAVGGSLTSDGRFVITSQPDGRTTVYDARTWARLHEITGHVRALSADGGIVVTTSPHDAALVQAWSVDDATRVLEHRVDPSCTDMVAGNGGVLCIQPRVPAWTWLAFADGSETQVPAIDRAELVAVSPRGRHLAAAVEPIDGVTDIVVRELATGKERRHAVPSQRRHLWPEPLPQSDPVTIHELVVGDAGEVACATGETRVHLWSGNGHEHVVDVAHAPLALEPGAAAVWGLADRPKFNTLHRFGFDGSETPAPGGPEPIGVFSSRSLVAFADDEVLVLHGGGVDRYVRTSARWQAPTRAP